MATWQLSRSRRPVLLFGFAALGIGSVAVAAILYSQSLTSRAYQRNTAFIRLTESVQQKVSIAHLWLEELLGGDSSIDLDVDVYPRIDEAMVLIRSGLAGGDTEIGHVDAIPPESARSLMMRLDERVHTLRASIGSRWQDRLGAGRIGAEEDQEFDAIFREIVDLCAQIATEMDSYIAHDLRTVRLINDSILFLFVALFIATAMSLARMHRAVSMRARELESLVAERTASLAASEQRTRRINEDLALARDQAEQASQTKSQFLAHMSHEIRTPMNGVLGMTSLLLRTPLSQRQREYAETVRNSGAALLKIINDILDFSKLEADKLAIETIDMDVRQVVKEVVDLVAPESARKRLQLDLKLDDSIPLVVGGDPVRLGQVIGNLLGNAIKFTEHGSVCVRGTVLSRLPDAPRRRIKLRFEVEDSGIGIGPEETRRLFRSFSQADGTITRRYGGTGLGLAISKQLVELMNGEIGVTSQTGRGSTFWFTVWFEDRPGDIGVAPVATKRTPAAEPAPAPDSNDAANARDAPSPLPEDAPCILVVEDNRVNQLVAEHMLRELGYRADIVGNGSFVDASLGSRRYAAILMDCQMPEVDGYSATAAIRSRADDSARTPVIAMTAHAMNGERDKVLAAGMNDFLTKPVQIEELNAVLRRWLPASQVPAARSPVKANRSAVSKANAGDGVATAERPRLDAALLNRLRDNNQPGFFAEIVDLFAVESSRRLAAIRDAVRDGRVESLHAEAHKLHGMCRNIGALRMAELSAAIEAAARDRDAAGAPGAVVELTTEFEATCAALAQERSRV
jgi:signal transduction histidine kinase/FixJ family two-component response regulator/HPt (histidine-containing phosphotransfer) domain-containing protein